MRANQIYIPNGSWTNYTKENESGYFNVILTEKEVDALRELLNEKMKEIETNETSKE